MINAQVHEIINDWGIRTTSYVVAVSDSFNERNEKGVSSVQLLARLKSITSNHTIEEAVISSPRLTQIVYGYAIQQAIKYPNKSNSTLYTAALNKANSLISSMPFLIIEENDVEQTTVSRLGKAEEIVKSMLANQQPKNEIMKALTDIGIDNKATANSYYYRFKNL